MSKRSLNSMRPFCPASMPREPDGESRLDVLGDFMSLVFSVLTVLFAVAILAILFPIMAIMAILFAVTAAIRAAILLHFFGHLNDRVLASLNVAAGLLDWGELEVGREW